MRPFIVGIGGCGGNVASHFLKNEDIGINSEDINRGRWFIKNILREHPCQTYTAFAQLMGLWIEEAGRDVNPTMQKRNEFETIFGHKDEAYPCYVIPSSYFKNSQDKQIADLYKKVVERGFDPAKEGFFSEAEYLKSVFEIIEMENIPDKNNPLVKPVLDILELYTTYGKSSTNKNICNRCDSILFISSLGGGTGTGYINPITKSIRKGREYPVFALGLLAQRGNVGNRSEEKIALSATIALYDLLSKSPRNSVSGLILIDNEILKSSFGDNNYWKWDDHVFQAMKPFIESREYPGENHDPIDLDRDFPDAQRLHAPVLIPCYHKEPMVKDPEEKLVEKALNEGRLFPCDPSMADKIFVFTRGFINKEKLISEIAKQIGINDADIPAKIYNPWRKMGDGRNSEILILLRNPYGSEGAFNDLETITFEKRLYQLIEIAIKRLSAKEEVIDYGKPVSSKVSLIKYFYGLNGLKEELVKIQEELPKLEGESFKKGQELKSELLMTIERLEDAKERVPLCLQDELNRSLRIIERGEKPIFRNELTIFKDSSDLRNEAEEYSETIQQNDDLEIKRIARELSDLKKHLRDKGILDSS